MDQQLRRHHDAAARSRDAAATRVRRATAAVGVAATLGATGLGLVVASAPGSSAVAAVATHRTTSSTSSTSSTAPSTSSAASSSTTPTTTTPVTVSGQS